MFKNLLRPRWIILTLLLAFLIYLFIELSGWQFDRYHQRIDRNDDFVTAIAGDPIPIENVSQMSNLKQWGKVSLSGQYLDAESKLVRKRYLKNSLGFWVLTPFRLANNEIVLVNRGWIPSANSSNSEISIPMSPTQQVLLEGYLQPMEKFKANPTDLPSNQINDINVEKFNVNIYPNFYVQVSKSSPAEKDIGIIYLPEVSNGPHLSYAIQWILFALLLPIGWYVLLKNEDKN
jgi:cytochrome oxidase assembly protein ShyY1